MFVQKTIKATVKSLIGETMNQIKISALKSAEAVSLDSRLTNLVPANPGNCRDNNVLLLVQPLHVVLVLLVFLLP